MYAKALIFSLFVLLCFRSIILSNDHNVIYLYSVFIENPCMDKYYFFTNYLKALMFDIVGLHLIIMSVGVTLGSGSGQVFKDTKKAISEISF